MKRIDFNFCDIHWGDDEAKLDKKLNDYFVRVPNFDELLNGEKRYIIGRKGTGKTAILQQVITEASISGSFCTEFSLKDFPLQELRNLSDKSSNGKSRFVPIWQFLILIEICRNASIEENCENLPAQSVLRSFIRENFSEISLVSTLKKVRSNENKVNISPEFLGWTSSKKSELSTEEAIHFSRLNDVLINYLKKLGVKANYFVLFDELDEGWSSSDKNFKMILLSLLRAIENTFMSLRDNIKFRPILALRSDIFDSLEDNDLNKLDDFILRLKWSASPEGTMSLLSLVEKRIAASTPLDNLKNSWLAYTQDSASRSGYMQESEIWKFITIRTFERPRDLIKFLKYCKNLSFKGKLTMSEVKKVEEHYSRWFFNEFKDEIQSYLPVWKEACDVFKKFKTGRFSVKDIVGELEKSSAINNYLTRNNLTAIDIIEQLFEFSVIGNYKAENSRWFFKFKDESIYFDPDLELIVHFGFSKYFGHVTK